MGNSYSLYGLSLTSDWALPYSAGETARGVSGAIALRKAHRRIFSAALRDAPPLGSDEKWHQYVRLDTGGDYLRWSGLFEFLVSPDGRHIGGRSLGAASPEAFHTYLLGQVLSHAMLKLGIEPLHATAAVFDGRAVAFMGDCGLGKSSLGASLVRAGHPLLTDDLLTLEGTDLGIVAHPGPPRIKLFPEMAKALLGRDLTGLPMNPLTRKLVIPLEPGESQTTAVPLQVIYVLSPASPRVRRVTIRRLTQRQALLEILRNTFNRDVTHPARLEQQFTQAAWVSRNVSIKLLSYPRDVAMLPAVRDAVATDILCEASGLAESQLRVRLAG